MINTTASYEGQGCPQSKRIKDTFCNAFCRNLLFKTLLISVKTSQAQIHRIQFLLGPDRILFTGIISNF